MTAELFTATASFAQERLWFLDQLLPGQGGYDMAAAVRLRGALVVEVLERSLGAIVRRHESLRTVFRAVDGVPLQVIAAAGTFALPVVDLSGAADRLGARLGAEAARGFDLERGPLFRAVLYRLGADEHVLVLLMHHIVSDKWSVGVLLKELAVLYADFAGGREASLPELPIQYADYAEWQRGWLRGDALAAQLAYWRDRLSGAPQVLELPTDRPRPPVETHRGARHFFPIPREVSEQVAACARREGVTMFMTLLAAFEVLLWRYTGQEDLLVGTPVANRGRTELEGLIGLFVNTLVLRADLSGDPAVRELLRRVREACLGAYANQDLPFERLVEELHPARDLSRNPLFQVMLVFHNLPAGESPDLPGLSATPVDVDPGRSQMDLTLEITEADGTLAATLEYSTDLFDQATVERLGGHFVALLRSLAADPDQPISTLDLLPPAEKQRLLIDWNATAVPVPDGRVHQLFEARAARTPDAAAVVFADEVLTYAELNARANQLAHALIALGVAPDAPVAIALERSPAMIVALLATLKAGGAYVPLDPGYPAERLAFMLADSGARILLTQEGLRSRLPATAAHTLCLDAAGASIGRQPRRNPERPVAPEHLAYVIYTSGSTGQPKGVAVTHLGLSNLAGAQIRSFGLTPDSRVLQFASFSFDASVSETVMALCAGAALYLPTDEQRMPGAPLWQQLREADITHLTLPPTALAALPRQELPRLQSLIVAGEACPPPLAAFWSRGRSFFNAYGPTETTVCATIAECAPADLDGVAPLPIGRPIANTRVYVLDRHDQPTPIGVPGELHVGGAGVARGYLNRPQLTAERFIPDPFSGVPGARLYKTGDLVRYRPDGDLEFLGRIDRQVKLRGFRIELGEIEAVLAAHPGVTECVVTVREDHPGDQRLAGYLVTGAGASFDPDAARTTLRARLPEYMVPSAFVVLAALPLTPNGKLDLKALPAPDDPATATCRERVPPRTATERALAAIWMAVLHTDAVGIEDSFFDLGGHSLLAMQVISRVRQELSVAIPLQDLFVERTIARLATRCESLQAMQQAAAAREQIEL